LTLFDWWADSDPKGIGYQQFADNWTQISTWLGGLATPADIVGHSLGGAIAQFVASKWTSLGHQIDQLVTFNSPGVSNAAAVAFAPSRSQRVTHYVVNGDVVSMAGQAFLAGNVEMASFSDLTLYDFDKHLLPLTIPQYGSRQRPADLTWQSFSSVTALNQPSYVYTDFDYRLWVTGLQLAASATFGGSALSLVPAALLRRDTTEAARASIGTILHLLVDAGQWTITAANQFRLAAIERSHDLYEAFHPAVTNSFALSIDNGTPPAIRFDGSLGFDLGSNLSINLPSWLGGPITADHLLRLGQLDTSGAIDRNGLRASGNFSLLGGLATIGGSSELNWRQADLSVSGNIGLLKGFISATATTKVGADLSLTAGGGATVNIPTGVPIWGGAHLTGGEFLLKYTNNATLSDDFVAGWGLLGPIKIGLRAWLNGDWDFLNGKEIAALQRPARSGAATTAAAASGAPSFFVDPGTNWLLLSAEWENASPSAAVELTAPDGTVLTEDDIVANPQIEIVPEVSTPQRRVVRVDLPSQGEWELSLVDSLGLGSVNYSAMVDVPPLTLDFASASGGSRRSDVSMTIDVSGSGSAQSRVAIYYDTDGVGRDGVLLADNLTAIDGAVEYTWSPAEVAPGNYHLYAVLVGTASVPVVSYCDTPVMITEVQPEVVSANVSDAGGQQRPVFEFSQDVNASLSADDVSFVDLVTGLPIPAEQLAVEYDAYSNKAYVDAAAGGGLASGWYAAKVKAGGIVNGDNETLTNDFDFNFIVVKAADTLVLPHGVAGAIVVNALSIAADGTLDLTDNDLIFDYTGASPLANVTELVKNGFNFGDWRCGGITSSTAANPLNNGNYVLGAPRTVS
jgi:hypothetical protein